MFRTSEHCTTLNSAIILLVFVRESESGPCENKSIKREIDKELHNILSQSSERAQKKGINQFPGKVCCEKEESYLYALLCFTEMHL